MALTKASQNVITPNIVTTDTAQTISGVKTFSSSISAPNVVTTDTTQTITGIKTFTGSVSTPNLVTIDTTQTINAPKTFTVATTTPAVTITQTGIGDALRVEDSSSDTSPFVIAADGNVGIGEPSPAQKLVVNGNIVTNSTGIIQAGQTVQSLGNITSVNDSALNSLDIGKGGGNILGNSRVGYSALGNNISGTQNTAFGANALIANTTGGSNTAVGYIAGGSITGSTSNTAVGNLALRYNVSGSDNTAVGAQSGQNVTSGQNSFFGYAAGGLGAMSGDKNTFIGGQAGLSNISGTQNVAIGFGSFSSTAFSGSTCLGTGSQVTASNQLQLGDPATTPCAYAALSVRSDIRDKSDIRDTTLGLEFINLLRPVDYKWDMRESYRKEEPQIVFKPLDLKEDASDEDRVKYAEELAAHEAYNVAKDKWLEDFKLSNITHDGSKKRNRFHHGLIAQEVKAVLDEKGIDFGGFQDHKINGGDDVLSLGYGELIAPLIKAVQELSAEVAALKAK